MLITGTHIAYLHVCHRKLWLFSNGIQMEHTSELVAEGKQIADSTYLDRDRKYTELAIEGIKIDFYDARNKTIHEVKKSDRIEYVHKAQVIYYMYILYRNGIEDPHAILEYPKLRQREAMNWDKSMIETCMCWMDKVESVASSEHCPSLAKKTICKKCSYFELCYIGE